MTDALDEPVAEAPVLDEPVAARPVLDEPDDAARRARVVDAPDEVEEPDESWARDALEVRDEPAYETCSVAARRGMAEAEVPDPAYEPADRDAVEVWLPVRPADRLALWSESDAWEVEDACDVEDACEVERVADRSPCEVSAVWLWGGQSSEADVERWVVPRVAAWAGTAIALSDPANTPAPRTPAPMRRATVGSTSGWRGRGPAERRG